MKARIKDMFAQYYSARLAAHHQRFLLWYRQLGARQQQLVVVAIFFAAALALVFGLWQPMQNQMADAERHYKEQQELYVWVMKPGARIKAGPQTDASPSQTITADIDKSAEKLNLKIGKLTVDQNTMHLQLDDVYFSQLVQWLYNMEQKYNVRVQSLDMTQHDTSQTGSVSLDLSY